MMAIEEELTKKLVDAGEGWKLIWEKQLYFNSFIQVYLRFRFFFLETIVIVQGLRITPPQGGRGAPKPPLSMHQLVMMTFVPRILARPFPSPFLPQILW